MIGVVDVGGGLRGVYGAAVFDWCLENKISFDYCIGVSAGSANIASFLAQQKGRNKKFYLDYSGRKDYMSFRNLITKGSFLDLEYIYGDALANSCGEYPLDFETMIHSKSTFKIVSTNAETGQPIYFDMHDMVQDDYGAIKGSSCVPIAVRAYKWQGYTLYDGGISDPIPYEKCFEAGCDKVVVVLTRPKDDYRDPKKDEKSARLLQRKYPNAAVCVQFRAETYNKELKKAHALEEAGRLLIIAPDDISGLSTLKRDVVALEGLYQKGLKDAEAIRNFL